MNLIKVLYEIYRLSEAIGESGSFVIGPDGRIFIDFAPHGDVVFQYPEILKKANKIIGSEEEISKNAIAGSPKLYDILMNEGFVRGGISSIHTKYGNKVVWLTFKKLTRKAGDTLLKLIAEEKPEGFVVDNGNNKSVEYTKAEFIEKYL